MGILSIANWLWGVRYVFIVGMVALQLGLALGEFKGKSQGVDKQIAAQNVAIIKGVEKREKKENEIRSLSNDDLVRRYCRWVFDIPYDQCVQTVVPQQ